MIQANELRIGNFLTSKTWKGAHKVQGVLIHDIETYSVFVDGCEHKNEPGIWFELEPIHLTEEWLIKLGFSKFAGWFEIKINGLEFSIHLEASRLSIGNYEKEQDSVYSDVINPHVHWLQNWVYFNTGQELQLTQ